MTAQAQFINQKLENQMIVRMDSTDIAIQDLSKTQQLCSALMKTPHYAKMGEVGIFAVVQKANSIGMNPLEALNGGMYFVQGKVEMQGQAMLALIRQHGHSVQIDPKSTDSNVVMHGKRADNGDTWAVNFSVEDAKKAGIFRNQWEKYPKTMCIWRCVSMLGRFLFSDILKGCYVQGEISEAPSFDAPVDQLAAVGNVIVQDVKHEIVKISNDEAVKLLDIVEDCSPDYVKVLKSFMKKHKIETFFDLPKDLYEKILAKAISEKEKYASMKTIDVTSEVSNEAA